MNNLNKTKYFLHKIDENTSRFDVEFLDPRNRLLKAHLQHLQKTKSYNLTSVEKLCYVFDGKTASKYVEDGIPIIKVRNVTDKGIDWKTDHVSEEFFEKNSKIHIQKNDILLTSTGEGTIGRVDIYTKETQCITDGHVTVIRVKDDKVILPRYLLYYLRSKLCQVQIGSRTVGSTGQTELNESDINEFLVVYPEEIEEQQNIVEEIFELEKDAEKNEALVVDELKKVETKISEELQIDIKHRPKKFYSLQLSRTSERMDFEFNNPFYAEYEELMKSSKIPFVEIKELVNFISDTINPLDKPDEKFLYVDIGNIDTCWGKMIAETMIGSEMTSSRMRRLIHKGQILVSTTRPTRRAIAIVPEEMDGQVCSTGFAVLECKKGFVPEYIFHMLRSEIIVHQFQKFSSGSGYPEIGKKKDLPRIRIPCPETIDRQKEIVQELKSIIEHAQELFDSVFLNRKKAIEKFEKFLS